MILLPLLKLLLLFFGEVGSQSGLPYYHFIHHVTLDAGRTSEIYRMLWTPEEKYLVVELQVASLGYVGVGFSPTGGMGGADIFFGWVDDSGTVRYMDMHATSNGLPIKDPSQDYDLLGGYQNGTHTVLRFTRPWTTCDDKHDWQLTGDTIKVIWAYSATDPRDESDLQYHGVHRGTKNMLLREPRIHAELFNEDLDIWDIRAPNVELPGDLHTIYWCKMYKAPPMRKKTHYVGFIPIVQESTALYVHHMILYECTLDKSSELMEKYVDTKGTQCYGANMPPSWDRCTTPIIVWAIGSDGEAFPEHVGLPLGEEHGGSTYFMLEVHYDNPNQDTGVVDASGLRLFVTEDLREHDAGTIWIGHQVTPMMIIPPGVSDWTTMGQCSADCTGMTLPKDGVKAFNGFLHTHLLGRGIAVRQIRDGKELPTVFRDDNYDFNYQQNRVLREEMTILPGDTLMVECYYNSSQRIMPTFAGTATTDEMCLAMLTFYPRQKISRCSSRPTLNSVLGFFGITELYPSYFTVVVNNFGGPGKISSEEEKKQFETQLTSEYGGGELDFAKLLYMLKIKEPEGLQNISLYEVLLNPGTWQTPGIKDFFQQVTEHGPHDNLCLTYGESWKKLPTLSYPVFEPYEPPTPQCIPPGMRPITAMDTPTRSPPFAKTSTSTASTADTTTVTTTTRTRFATIVTATTVFSDGTTTTSTTTTINLKLT